LIRGRAEPGRSGNRVAAATKPPRPMSPNAFQAFRMRFFFRDIMQA
jgi:hypothetical protein